MRSLVSQVLIFLFLCLSVIATAQDINDLSNVDIDDLSDAQIEAYLTRAQESGLTMQQLELIARQRGMTSTQLSKLRQRIAEVQSGITDQEGIVANDDRLREEFKEPERVTFFDDFIVLDSLVEEEGLPIFGASIFENSLTFQSPTNVSTPRSYILGPGDEVIVDIYGASETTYRETISPDGKILVSGVGPISLGGVSVEIAKQRVYNRLSSIYSGLKGSRPNTFMELSVGNIRTILVNVVGNVKRPGTYAMSSFSSAFNALFEAGGPSETGTMRDIAIMRSGERVATLDVYKYFFEGDLSGNPQLQDGDAIVVKTFQNRVKYAGEVKQAAIYEFLDGETFEELWNISGGTASEGYNKSITVFRNKGIKSLLTFDQSQFSSIELLDGDSINIPPIPETFSNRIRVEGAVEQPGFYELKKGMKVSQVLELVRLAQDAYLKRGNIISLNNDLTLSNTSFDINSVLDGAEDHVLRNGDLVKIPSILEVVERKTVTILGEVNNEGEYPFIEGMTVEDLLAISGGLKLSANTSSIEVARRVSKDAKEFQTATIFNYSISEDLGFNAASSFQLEPFDLITIKASALFRTQKTVKIEGEVLKPGYYALESEEDRLTDLLQRAGGLTTYAYPQGASLIRDLDPHAEESEDQNLETTSTDEGEFYRRQQLEGLIERDSLDELNSEVTRKESVGIQFEKALENPSSRFNLILRDGDVLSIPKQLQTVRVRGQVLYPTRVSYDKTSKFKNYVSLAGGFSDDARIKRSYIVYANGRAERTKQFLFFRSYPKVEPGSDIFVPERPDRRRMTPAEILGITSGLATLSFAIFQIINISR